MSTILYNQNASAARSRSLGTLNGIDFGLMTLDTATPSAVRRAGTAFLQRSASR